jgi:2-desacetyl-2-hydroxyethyl bacteriochlorophyllide A dehydrogenase
MPGIKLNFPVVPGLDLAGEIAAVGDGVTDWRIGDRVVVDPVDRVGGGLMGETQHGGCAELCRVRTSQLFRIPNRVSFEQAACLPCAYGTALRMMNRVGQVQAGERVLILGASGGVGVCCVQLAKLVGAEVIACAGSPEKGDRLRALGADDIILYTEEDFLRAVQQRYGKPHRRRTQAQGGMDVVVNFTGGDTWVKSLRTLKRGGRLLTCGATAGFAPQEDLRYIWTFELQIRGANSWDPEDVSELLDMVAVGKLEAVVDRTYPLADGADAVRQIEERRVFGKVLVVP